MASLLVFLFPTLGAVTQGDYPASTAYCAIGIVVLAVILGLLFHKSANTYDIKDGS